MKKIAILVDSGSQIKQDNQYGIFVVPLVISVNNKEYFDGDNITSDEVFDMMALSDVSIKTSQPSTGSVINVIQEIKRCGFNYIIALPIASGLSDTGNGIRLACQMENIPFTIVDTKATALIQKYLAITAMSKIKEGMEVAKIIDLLNRLIENSGTFITTPNLYHLQKSGRITPALAKLGSMLKVVPIMYLNNNLNGKIDILGKVRTFKRANLKIMDTMINDFGVNKDYIVVIQHVGCLNFSLEMKDILSERLNTEVQISNLPTVVGGHMGVGGVGYQFIKKYKN